MDLEQLRRRAEVMVMMPCMSEESEIIDKCLIDLEGQYISVLLLRLEN